MNVKEQQEASGGYCNPDRPIISKSLQIFKYFIIKSEIIKLNFKIAHGLKCRLEKILIFARTSVQIFKNIKNLNQILKN